MKEFLDSKAGRTLIIAAISAGTAIFAVPWDSFETVARAGGGAFFGALGTLVFYLKRNADEEKAMEEWEMRTFGIIREKPLDTWQPAPTPGMPNYVPASWESIPNSKPITDFDGPYHFAFDGSGRHPGEQSLDCELCEKM